MADLVLAEQHGGYRHVRDPDGRLLAVLYHAFPGAPWFLHRWGHPAARFTTRKAALAALTEEQDHDR